MHKFISSLLAVALIGAIALTLAPAPARADAVYSRATNTLATTTGAATWTNTQQYAALELKRIWVASDLGTTSTVTVNRITADGVWTQAVGTVTCSAGAGSTTSFTAAYMKGQDKLAFTSSSATGAVVMVEYVVQMH